MKAYLLSLLVIFNVVTEPVIIAHRGASGILPEHSLPAVTAAHMMNVDFIEQDVVLSKDGVPVVLHDIHLDTVTNVKDVFPQRARQDGRFYAIDFDLSEIKQLNLHERTDLSGKPVFPDRFPLGLEGLKVPTLEEEIQLIQGLNQTRKKNVGLYVELKSPTFHQQAGFQMEDIVLAMLKKFGYSESSDNVYMQCFDSKTLQSLRKKTSLKLIQLIGFNSWGESEDDYEQMLTAEGLKKVSRYADGIGPSIQMFLDKKQIKNRELITFAKKYGLAIHPYTLRADALPEGFSDINELFNLFAFDLGVDGVFTDHPERLPR